MTRARSFAMVLGSILLAMFGARALAVEPAACLSSDPNVWPQPSKPYFLIVADTSGSMSNVVSASTVCPGYGNDRRAHLRCAISEITKAYGGQARIGLMHFARKQQNCTSTCFSGCTYADFPANATAAGCGPGTGSARRGGFVDVPVAADAFWVDPPVPDNAQSVLGHTDNVCTGSTELFADGGSPLNGSLRDAKRYFAGTWTAQDSSVTYASPMASQDLDGAGVNGGTACRAVSVILIADGGETCDTAADTNAAATDLFANGVLVGGHTFKIPVHVLDFSNGGATTELNQIAAAGGTGSAVTVSNESQLITALGTIIQARLPSETCDNLDNNCNGCTDEGYTHFSFVTSPGTCCAWNNAGQRNTCLANFRASITAANPLGTASQLPCTSATQGVDPLTWLCNNPGETCDNADNNGDGQIDEGMVKCGSPAHCPVAETCNGADDDCDGVIDNGLSCSGHAVLPEVCDGCDNDYNGIADDNVAPVACGFSPPNTCAGTMSCRAAQPVTPGGCVANGGFNACSATPQTEACDGVDNDCNGAVDDNILPTLCTAPGTPPDLAYGGSSQCRLGQKACGGACIGFVGPTGEVTDGIDNDCDGTVDNIALFKNGFE